MFVCNRACVLMCTNVRVDACGCMYICIFVCMFDRMHVCRHAFVREVHGCKHTNVRSHTDRCMRFDMYIRTNVRTNGPSNRHTDDCVLIHKMAYSAFIFIKEDFFYLSKRSRPRWNMPCMAFHQGLNCLPVYRLSSIKNENGLMITWYMAYSAFIFIKEDFFYLSKRSRPRWNVPCMAFHQALNCLPVYRLSSIKNENGLMITWYIVNEHACTRAFACLSHAR